MRANLKTILISGSSLLAGVAIGGYLFSKTQRRPVLSFRNCKDRCLKFEELMGLLASIALNRFPRLIPAVVAETDMTVAIKHPDPKKRIHYVIIPKKDITNVGELGVEDKPYLIDSFAIIQELTKEHRITDYQVMTNGPGKQQMTYLHFHLMAD